MALERRAGLAAAHDARRDDGAVGLQDFACSAARHWKVKMTKHLWYVYGVRLLGGWANLHQLLRPKPECERSGMRKTR